jgi:hypothetical protein
MTLTNFYRCTIESILSVCITDWYDNCTIYKCRALQKVGQPAQHIIGGTQPAPQDIYNTWNKRPRK